MSAAKAGSSGSTTGKSDRVGRGTRWTDEQVEILLATVKESATAKEAFEVVAEKIGKNTGTVQQKYYNLQRKAGRGRPRKSAGRAATGSPVRRTTSATPDLRVLTIDELVKLASSVKTEVDRRRKELDDASKLLAS